MKQFAILNFPVEIECVCSCDQKPYFHNETKGGICIKTEFKPQKNIPLLHKSRRFFIYSSNMAAVTSCEHTLLRSITLLYFEELLSHINEISGTLQIVRKF